MERSREITKRDFYPLPGCRFRSCAGTTLLGVLTATSLFAIGGLGVVATLVSSTRLKAANRETAVAALAARSALETMRATAFEEIFATFNSRANDNPDGQGTAPGASFAVEGLSARTGDAD
jgi:type II secretory pathway component PulJ